VKAAKRLGERFDGQIFSIVNISHHLQDHVIDGTFISLQQFRISFIFTPDRKVYEAKILDRLIRKIPFQFLH
jgi:hypothetical protein